MAVFTIFWCAVLGIFFWLFSMLLKSVQSAINGIYEAVIGCESITILGLVGIFIFCVLYHLAAMIRGRGFWDVIGELILWVILLVLFICFLGSVGAFVFQIANIIVSVVMGVTITIFDALNPVVENAYVFFLKKIKQKADLL